ncbi:YceI family protein [Paucibacter sp. APW11]|uniref:YceI family protein n=1 Tax=Roseateles aquae TaxID=3077235 RepID=A0ABU3PBS4_9BURK|nr:YceI family protein [Paucibacter sp. APW11]MDT9000017.1 YceI family protein [Paucibacter sp. APW11]
MTKTLLSLALLATATFAQAESASYTIEPTHTFVTYEISHFGTSTNRGRFDKKEGTVQLDRAAKTGKVEISFDIASVNTGVMGMDKHLQSDDFFASAKFPTAKFVGDKFVFNGDKVSEVSGQLTLKDKTAPVTLKASNFNCYQSPMIKREVCGGDFSATIDRTQWGIDYGLAWGFPKEVKLVIQVEAVRQ